MAVYTSRHFFSAKTNKSGSCGGQISEDSCEKTMNAQTYDLFMVLVLVGATIFGFWKGMAWQLASLASLVVSYFIALRFSAQLAPMFGQPPTNRFVAMFAIFTATSFVVWIAFRFVSGVIDKIKLQAFDKEMGAVFGLAKGVLLCVAITFFAVSAPLPPEQRQAIANSESGHYIVAFLNKAETMVPPEYHQMIVPYLDKAEERISTGNPNGQGFQLGWPGGSTMNNTSATNNSTASSGLGWPKINWPPAQSQPQTMNQPQTSQPQSGWPQQPNMPQPNPTQPAWPAQTPSQLGWPAQTQAEPQPALSNPAPTQQVGQTQPLPTAQNVDPYGVPREPNPFPDPGYSAERQTGGTY
jgi:membrane protein required for colicin V production